MSARKVPAPRGRRKVAPLPSFAVSAGAVSVRVEPTRAATQACVVVGIPFETNHWVFDALRGSCFPPANVGDTSRLDETVLAFAAFEAVREKLDGTTVDAIRNRVVDASCGAQGAEFLISVTCAPTLASARKCAGIVLQNLRWGTFFSRYSNWCQSLGVRPDKAAFSQAAAEANAAVATRVVVVATGKVAATEAGVAKTVEALGRKLKDAPPKETGRPRVVLPEELSFGGEPRYVAHPAGGLAGVVVHNFVDSSARGEPSHLVSGTLFVAKKKEADAARLAKGERPTKYVQALLGLKEEARGALVFIAAKGCFTGTADLVAAGGLPAEPTAAAIRSAFS